MTTTEPLRNPTIHFAHPFYRMAERFALRDTGIAHFQTWSGADALARVHETEVLVVSGLWTPALLEAAHALRYIQVSAAGYNQFDLDAIRARGVRLANGSGINRNAVADQAMGLMLTVTRRLAEAFRNQQARHWRGIISALDQREDELAGRTLLIYGMGAIGERLAHLARAFDMHVIGIKRDPSRHGGVAHEVHAAARWQELLPRADFVVLTCPLTEQTRNLVDAKALAAMRADAWLVNVARGGCVDTAALVQALQSKQLGGAALDVTEPEPLPVDSPLWGMENVLITPHSAGETRHYEDNVVDILLANLERLSRGEAELVNGNV